MNPIRSPRRRDVRALTLIELLILIAVVGVLAGILIPAFQSAREQVRIAVCRSNLRDIGAGVHLYARDNDDRLPPIYRTASSFTSYWMDSAGMPRNLGLLRHHGYLEDERVFFCPSRNANPIEVLGYDQPLNIGSDGRRLRSSYPARYVVNVNWRLTDSIERPTLGTTAIVDVIIYSDFVGVKNFGGGGVSTTEIGPSHGDQGYNRLFGDGSVRWTPPGRFTRQISSSDPGGGILVRLFEELDEL